MYNTFVVAQTQRPGCVWTISKELMGKLKINENEQVTLHFGSSEILTNVDQLLSPGTFSDNRGIKRLMKKLLLNHFTNGN